MAPLVPLDPLLLLSLFVKCLLICAISDGCPAGQYSFLEGSKYVCKQVPRGTYKVGMVSR